MNHFAVIVGITENNGVKEIIDLAAYGRGNTDEDLKTEAISYQEIEYLVKQESMNIYPIPENMFSVVDELKYLHENLLSGLVDEDRITVKMVKELIELRMLKYIVE